MYMISWLKENRKTLISLAFIIFLLFTGPGFRRKLDTSFFQIGKIKATLTYSALHKGEGTFY